MPKTRRNGELEDAPIAARTRRRTAEHSPSTLQLRSRSVPAKRKPELALGSRSVKKRSSQTLHKASGPPIAAEITGLKLKSEGEEKEEPLQGRVNKATPGVSVPAYITPQAIGMDSTDEALDDQELVDDPFADLSAAETAAGASNALQGLLRRFGGGGFEDRMPGGGRSKMRFQSILVALREEDDMSAQVTALTELCEVLSISTEESLQSCPFDQLIPVLVKLLSAEHSPDTMLLAARAITFLADVVPATASAIVRHGAVTVLCARLLAIDYIDLAEQSLQALNKLSSEHPQAVLNHGGLLAVLSYLDFFQTSVQRVAVATAAAMCVGLTSDSVEAVTAAVPILTNILQYEDVKVVDHACLALSRIAESYARYPERLDMLCNNGLITNAVQLVEVTSSGSMRSQLSASTYYGLIKLLGTCSAGSAAVAEALLAGGLPATLQCLLNSSTLFTTAATSASSVLRSNDQLLEVVALIAKILPPIPEDASPAQIAPAAAAATTPATATATATSAVRSRAASARAMPSGNSTEDVEPAAATESQQPPVSAAVTARAETAAAAEVSMAQRVAFLRDNSDALQSFSERLLRPLMHVYVTTMQPSTRNHVLTSISQMVYYNEPHVLRTLLADVEMSSFVGGLLGNGDSAAAVTALTVAHTLMIKLPDVFKTHFVKEGVLHAVGKLIASVGEDDGGAEAAVPDQKALQQSAVKASSEARSKRTAVTNAERGVKAAEEAKTAAASTPGGSSSVREPQKCRKALRTRTRKSACREQETETEAEAAESKLNKAAETAAEALIAAQAESVKASQALVAAMQALKSGEATIAAMRHPQVRARHHRLQAAAAGRAFKAQHFPGEGSASTETDGTKLLRQLCSRLSSEGGVAALLEALQGTSSSISSFEFLTSGAVAKLKHYLLGKDLKGEKQRLRKHLLRTQTFASVALQDSGSVASGGRLPMQALVRKLQAALATEEDLPVPSPMVVPQMSRRHFGSGFGGGAQANSEAGSLASGLAALAQPFKLQLKRCGSDPSLQDYGGNVVLIEPLATIGAIEDFLWPRVHRSPEDIAAAAAVAARRAREAASRRFGERQPATQATSPNTEGGEAAGVAQPLSAPQTARAAASKAQPIPRPNRPHGAKGCSWAGSGSNGALAPSSAERRVTRAAVRAAASGSRTEAPEPAAEGSAAATAGQGPNQAGSSTREEGAAAPAADREPEGEDDVMLDQDDEDEDEGEEVDMDGYDDEEEGIELGLEGYDEDLLEGASHGSNESARLGLQRMQVHDVLLGDTTEAAGGASTSPPRQQPPQIASAAPGSAPPSATPVAARTRLGAASAAQLAGAAPSSGAKQIAPRANPQESGREEPSRPAPPRDRSAATRQGRSYAAAAATNTRAGEETAAREAGLPAPPPPPPRLQFTVNSQSLEPTCTIFQAVQMARQQPGGILASAAAGDAASDPLKAQRSARRIWDDIHTLSYAAYDSNTCAASGASRGPLDARDTLPPRQPLRQGNDATRSALEDILAVPDFTGSGMSNATSDLLIVLILMESINRSSQRLSAHQLSGHDIGATGLAVHTTVPLGSHLPRAELVSNKVASKLAQLLKDVLAICSGTLPPWMHVLVREAKFLFPFPLRCAWFRATALGQPRALHALRAAAAAEGATGGDPSLGGEPSSNVGRLARQKVRVNRKRILDSGAKVMEMYASSRALLELEYFDEAGTGLGPTLEFYALLAQELQRKSLDMWRCEDGGGSGGVGAVAIKAEAAAGEGLITAGTPLASAAKSNTVEGEEASAFVSAPQGLFPPPLDRHRAAARLLGRFTMLGRAAAKALQDGRMLDVPLAFLFWRIAMGQQVDLYDVRHVDSGLGATLEKLAAAVAAAHHQGHPGVVVVDGVPVEDLCLSFVVPGYPEYVLRKGGTDIAVTAANCSAYVSAVVDATLGGGVSRQIEAFRGGFQEVIPLCHLSAFYEDEIETMLCGTGESWTVEHLASCIKFDHGYNRDSAPATHLLIVVAALDSADQRRFLRFVTGSPRLPAGGVAALQPRLTVVRKVTAGAQHLGDSLGSSLGASLGASHGTSIAAQPSTACDGDLPSVMTCANYIKLPPYSSLEVTRERLLFAIREGQGSFDLS